MKSSESHFKLESPSTFRDCLQHILKIKKVFLLIKSNLVSKYFALRKIKVESDVAAPSETNAEEIQPAPDVPDESAKVEEQNELAEKTVVSFNKHQLICSINSCTPFYHMPSCLYLLTASPETNVIRC